MIKNEEFELYLVCSGFAEGKSKSLLRISKQATASPHRIFNCGGAKERHQYLILSSDKKE